MDTLPTQPQEFESGESRGSGGEGARESFDGADSGRGNGNGEIHRWERRVRLWQSALDNLSNRLQDRNDAGSRLTSTNVQRLKTHLSHVSNHINRMRQSTQGERGVINAELEGAWRRFLDAFAEASRQSD